MEKGNEGDEIIFLSFRQIGCPIPDNYINVGQIPAELIVDIITRSLLLISGGEIQLPQSLPKNIASRHRICTTIAAKIKELGYLGDCGYNQLLYPVESQTRTLLGWIVEKLPRAEETAEQVLGNNSIKSRKIAVSLAEWKNSSWRLPVCKTGFPPKNIYNNYQFHVLPHSGTSLDRLPSLVIYKDCAIRGLPVDCSLLERHSIQLIHDSTFDVNLARDFDDEKSDATTINSAFVLDSTSNSFSDAKEASLGNTKSYHSVVKMNIKKAMSKQGVTATTGDKTASTSSYPGSSSLEPNGVFIDSSVTAKEVQLMSSTFVDLIQGITQEFTAATSSNVITSQPTDATKTTKNESLEVSRGTRFTHAIEFAQDATPTVSAASTTNLFAVEATKNAFSSQSIVSKDTAAAPMAPFRLKILEQEEQSRVAELDLLKEEITRVYSEVEEITKSQAHLSVRVTDLEKEIAEYSQETEKLEKDVVIKKKTLEMLPSASDNIKKLQGVCNNSSEKLKQLAEEWEVHREPLMSQIKEKEDSIMKRRLHCKDMVEEIKKYREDMISMIQDLKEKQEKAQVLAEEMDKLPKNINRAVYTHRIMDISASIVKQNKDISKVTNDIREIQKTINSNSNILQRADTVTEELIFNAATGNSQDSVMVDTYRRLKQLRTKFEQLVDTVSKIGQQEKMTRDLETKIDQEKSRISAQNFDRIQNDLDQILKENAQLVNQIKSLAASSKGK